MSGDINFSDYAWLIVFVIGIIIFIFSLITIEYRLNNKEKISAWLWIILFISIFTIVIAFGIYLYYIPVSSYNLITSQRNWDNCTTTPQIQQQHIQQPQIAQQHITQVHVTQHTVKSKAQHVQKVHIEDF